MEGEGKDKIVLFELYCKSCKYQKRQENEDPCWDCLTVPVNRDSHKPINWEEAKNDE